MSNNVYPETLSYQMNREEKILHYREKISFEEMCLLVEGASKSLFSESGEYRPYLKDVVIMSYVLRYFTDFKDYDDMSLVHEMVYSTDLYSILRCSIAMLGHVNTSIGEYVDYLSKRSKFDDLIDLLLELVQTVESKVEAFDPSSLAQVMSVLSNLKIDQSTIAETVAAKMNADDDMR